MAIRFGILGFDLHRLVDSIGSKDQDILDKYIAYFDKNLADLPSMLKSLEKEPEGWNDPEIKQIVKDYERDDEETRKALQQLVFNEEISYEDVLQGKTLDYLKNFENVLETDILDVLIYSQEDLVPAGSDWEYGYFENYFRTKNKLLEGEEKELLKVFTHERHLLGICFSEYGDGFLTNEEVNKLLSFVSTQNKYKDYYGFFEDIIKSLTIIKEHKKDLFFHAS